MGLFKKTLHDGLPWVNKAKMPSWVMLFFPFIGKAQSAEWNLISNGGLRKEGMTNGYMK